ncbi:hypothetical protein IBE48_09515 [Francisella philomiragia]|uniref:Uncharacterized protein n=1 Tax=Francisella philomiragia TaxID=28110 RepID=A0AAW3DDN3_9GAMM|nr:hypothetical protein [Francisella philomiragia]KFJ44120.1 hypothetical protein DR78_1962 [Francisella philomiragia]MBK2255689.1 hypothetical protein [Francisella philomiragia]MBK2274000.1 hypothetical protein [Francisella philomiragia]MBK2277841.1 hypothetical protein [Francisella philomiragia]MBK2281787.1 hypothetical protein [Francisella philomiragia]
MQSYGFDLVDAINTKPTTLKILGRLNNFEPLSIRSIGDTISANDFSISKGADADDMVKMNASSTRTAAVMSLAVGLIDRGELFNLYTKISRRIKSNPNYRKVVFKKPLLFQVSVQRNKDNDSIARFDDISLINTKNRDDAIRKARHLKKMDSLCGSRSINCLIKNNKNDRFYYQNIYILVSKQT